MGNFGLLLKGSSGNIQIDSTYKNHVVLASGSASLSAGDNAVNITDTTKTPIVAIKPASGGFSCHYGFTKSGSTYTEAKIKAGGSISIGWREYVYGLVNSLPSYGLVVYNSSGEAVYSSGDIPMRIVSVNSGSFAHSIGGASYQDKTVSDAANNFFILTNPMPVYVETYSINPFPPYWAADYYTRGLKYINGTTIRVGEFAFGGMGGPGYPSAPFNGWVNDYVLIEVKA